MFQEAWMLSCDERMVVLLETNCDLSPAVHLMLTKRHNLESAYAFGMTRTGDLELGEATCTAREVMHGARAAAAMSLTEEGAVLPCPQARERRCIPCQ